MPTRPIRTFTVLPHLPERLQALQKLAYNLWWCWNPEAVALFRRIDAEGFEALDHNPVKLLSKVEHAESAYVAVFTRPIAASSAPAAGAEYHRRQRELCERRWRHLLAAGTNVEVPSRTSTTPGGR